MSDFFHLIDLFTLKRPTHFYSVRNYSGSYFWNHKCAHPCVVHPSSCNREEDVLAIKAVSPLPFTLTTTYSRSLSRSLWLSRLSQSHLTHTHTQPFCPPASIVLYHRLLMHIARAAAAAMTLHKGTDTVGAGEDVLWEKMLYDDAAKHIH